MKRLFLVVCMMAVFGTSIFLCAPSIEAEIHVAKSLEWLTEESTLVIRGKVVGAKSLPHPQETFPTLKLETVMVKIQEVLKGDLKKSSIVFKRFKHHDVASALQWKESGHEFIFFMKKQTKSLNGIDFNDEWMLTADYPYGPIDVKEPKAFAVYIVSADMDSPNEGEKILKIIRDQAKGARSLNSFSKKLDVHEILLKNTPTGAETVEVPEDTDAFKNLFGGSSVYIIVPQSHPSNTGENL